MEELPHRVWYRLLSLTIDVEELPLGFHRIIADDFQGTGPGGKRFAKGGSPIRAEGPSQLT
jgi:hypothetical protein